MPRSPYYRALLSAAGIGDGLTSLAATSGSGAAAHAKCRPDIDGLRAVAVLPAGRCQVTDGQGLPLAFDYGHPTASGSILVAQQIRR